jgi:hypothetical protein
MPSIWSLEILPDHGLIGKGASVLLCFPILLARSSEIEVPSISSLEMLLDQIGKRVTDTAGLINRTAVDQQIGDTPESDRKQRKCICFSILPNRSESRSARVLYKY